MSKKRVGSTPCRSAVLCLFVVALRSGMSHEESSTRVTSCDQDCHAMMDGFTEATVAVLGWMALFTYCLKSEQ